MGQWEYAICMLVKMIFDFYGFYFYSKDDIVTNVKQKCYVKQWPTIVIVFCQVFLIIKYNCSIHKHIIGISQLDSHINEATTLIFFEFESLHIETN